MEKLTAETLAEKLWRTMNGDSEAKISPRDEASLAMEIIRSKRLMLDITRITASRPSKHLTDFLLAESDHEKTTAN